LPLVKFALLSGFKLRPGSVALAQQRPGFR